MPVPGVTQLEATAIHVMLASRPVKIQAAYLLPSRPLIEADLSTCLSGGLPVLMAGDLNAKHVDWNSRQITSGRRLRDYAIEHSCLIYGPETPTSILHNSSATPDVLDIVITNKGLVIPVYLITCSALSSDQLPVLIDTRCRSSYLNLPDFKRTDWVKFQACLEDRLPSTPKLRKKVKQSHYRPLGFQEVKAPRFLDNRHMKVIRLSALRTGRLYPPGNTPGTHFC